VTVGPSVDPFGGLEGADRDAALALNNLFIQFGLGSLAPKIVEFIQQGYAQDTIALLLQETPEYKQRFRANDARVRAGLPVLSPAEYIGVERSYREIMATAGLPVGFYDTNDDFTRFIEGDVSPTEVKARVDAASRLIYEADEETVNYFRQYYTQGDLVAYALDPDRAAPLIEKRIREAEIGGAAIRQGVAVSRETVERLSDLGVSRSAAQQGFGAVALEEESTAKLGGIYGDEVTVDELASEIIAGDAQVAKRRARLASQERAAFTGGGGISGGSLAQESGGQT